MSTRLLDLDLGEVGGKGHNELVGLVLVRDLKGVKKLRWCSGWVERETRVNVKMCCSG